jgi:hypothetical protein
MLIRREPGTPLEGRLTYSEAEFSFRFEVASPADLQKRIGGTDVASVSIGTLQVEVGVVSHRALFAWGLHPKTRWIESDLHSPNWSIGTVVMAPDADFAAGVSVRLVDVGEWVTLYDAASGWVRVSGNSAAEDQLVEIASGILLGSLSDQLISVWLKPEFE